MPEQMNKIFEPLMIYGGSSYTIGFALISEGTLFSIQASVAVLVGVTTSIYTVMKMMDNYEAKKLRKSKPKRKVS